MRRFVLVAALLAGCAPVSFRVDPEPSARSAWVTLPVIGVTHPEIDRATLAERIHQEAIEEVQNAGLLLAPEEAAADVVIACTVEDFWLGDEVVRMFGWKVISHGENRPSFALKFTLHVPGKADNEATAKDILDAGGYERGSAQERRTDALLRKISNDYAEVARAYKRK